MEQENRKHVLLLYRAMVPSVRLCGHCQMEYLARQGKVDYRAIPVSKIRNSDLNWADIVLIGRLDGWYEFQLVKKLHSAGKKLIYIIDDDLMNVPPSSSVHDYYAKEDIREQILGMIEESDAILSPSPLLLMKYASAGKEAFQIEEPALNPSPFRPHRTDQPVKIGFAGSIDRVGDIESILKDALLKVKQKYKDKVQFEFFGSIPSFADEIGAKCIPYCDSYDSYRKTLDSLEWDIGLAPMPDIPFHHCKHYNKFVEYAAAGVVGLYSDVLPYTRIKEKGFPARFCENTGDAWYDAICALVDYPEECDVLRGMCSKIVQTKFSITQSSKVFEKMIQSCALNNQQVIIHGAGLSRILFLLRRLVRKAKCHIIGRTQAL